VEEVPHVNEQSPRIHERPVGETVIAGGARCFVSLDPVGQFFRRGAEKRVLRHVELAGIVEAAAEAARRGREIAVREALNAVPRSAGVIVIDEGWRTVLELPI
jgi:hypothetical protein